MTGIINKSVLNQFFSPDMFTFNTRRIRFIVMISKSKSNIKNNIHEKTEMESSSLKSTNQNLVDSNATARFTLQNTCLTRREQLLTPQSRNISQDVKMKMLQKAIAKGEYLTRRALNIINFSDLISTRDKFFKYYEYKS